MSFSSITTTEIAPGKPVASTTQTKVKNNFEDHEERIQDIEAGSNVAYPPIQLDVYGYYGDQGPATGWAKQIMNFNIIITGARLVIDQAGVAGTTEIDLLVKSGVGSYTSIFTTKPSAAYTAGNDFSSTNQVLNSSNVAVLAGDIIRLDTTSVQTNGKSFLVRIDYIKG